MKNQRCWHPHESTNTSLVGGWATPLKHMKVNWDDYSIYGKIKHVPNHQPDINIPPTDPGFGWIWMFFFSFFGWTHVDLDVGIPSGSSGQTKRGKNHGKILQASGCNIGPRTMVGQMVAKWVPGSGDVPGSPFAHLCAMCGVKVGVCQILDTCQLSSDPFLCMFSKWQSKCLYIQ